MTRDDDQIARLIDQGLQRAALSDAALARIRANVEAEWRAANGRPRSHPFRWAGLAAGLAVMGLMAAMIWRNAGQAAVMGTVARVEGGSLVVHSHWLGERTLATGADLHSGETISTQGSALIAMANHDTLRIAAGTRITVRSPSEIELSEGRVYFDLPPETLREAPLRVRTPAGVVEHLGTQFEVALINRDVRIRVREGAVQLLRPQGSERAAAGTELLVTPANVVERHSIATYGRQWAWVEALAPDYDIEGRPLTDFLAWSVRETGRQLDFPDDATRDVAGRTILHGSVSGLTPLEALTRVLTTTTLRFELREDSIRVSSGG